MIISAHNGSSRVLLISASELSCSRGCIAHSDNVANWQDHIESNIRSAQLRW